VIKKLIFKLFLIISATTSLFAETASIDIEKSALNLVKIAVESYAMPGVTEFEKTQIDAMFLNDLKVSDRLGEKKRAKHRAEVEAMYAREKARKEAKKASSIWVKFKNLLTTPIAV
jgi:hypothetical protein